VKIGKEFLSLVMFRRSKNTYQGDLFKDISSQLSSRKQKLLDSKNGWQNVFYKEVVSQINELPYSVLYCKDNGRPNAPVRILIGMMILKEGNGWSDEQLYDECRFNIRVMRALGLQNMDDDIPTESTFYEFRKLLGLHQAQQGQDLLKETFLTITGQQVITHGVSGNKIRLDSKLINSNIAKSNRLQMIVEGVRVYIKGIDIDALQDDLDAISYEFLKDMENKSASNITYPLNSKEKKEMLVKMGGLIKLLLEVTNGEGSLLERIYKEQYEEIDEEEGGNKGDYDLTKGEERVKVVSPKKPKEIGSSSVQSIHDPEAAYRTKGQGASKQTVSGYHANITESCTPEDELNLILDIEVVAANVCEDAFLMDTVDRCQELINQAHGGNSEIEEVITDGGYDSIENRSQMLEEEYPTWSIAKMKGGRRIYEMSYNNTGELEVYDLKSGERCKVHFSDRAQKYVIQLEDGNRRYMSKEGVENYIKRQEVEAQVNKESYNLRASVESTIHQTFHRLKKNNKIVYRGLIKCQWYVISRAFWVNIVRIMDKNIKIGLIYLFLAFESIVKALILNPWKKMKNQPSFLF